MTAVPRRIREVCWPRQPGDKRRGAGAGTGTAVLEVMLGDPATVEPELLGGNELRDQTAIERAQIRLTLDVGEKSQSNGVGH